MSLASISTDERNAALARTREVPAVRRAVAILWHLGRHSEGLALSKIARELDMLPSTCLHILRELAAARLVAFEANGKTYRLGTGLLTLARQLAHQNPLVQAAQPVLNRLSREFAVGASSQERDGEDDMVVVAAASVLPGDMVSPGGRSALFTSASGRLMAAFGDFPADELRRRFSRVRWQDPPKFDDWLHNLPDVRRLGFAIDEGNFRRGITAIAAPLFDASGRVSQTISVTAITAQLDARTRKKLATAVKEAAREIMRAL